VGEAVSLTSKADGFVLGGYHAAPEDARHGGLVLIQEIFGVTDHIRELCEGFAADGYEVIAPSFYDRQERGFAAGRCEGVVAASCYYGRRIPELIAETPRCPTILHFGKRDPTIPPETVEQIRDAFPDLPVYVYDAGHGFASDRRADYAPDSARLARLRTLQLFSRSSGVRSEV